MDFKTLFDKSRISADYKNFVLIDGENLLPESKPDLSKLELYQQLREIYVLGNKPMPFTKNP